LVFKAEVKLQRVRQLKIRRQSVNTGKNKQRLGQARELVTAY
jgi:hypothetical protein